MSQQTSDGYRIRCLEFGRYNKQTHNLGLGGCKHDEDLRAEVQELRDELRRVKAEFEARMSAVVGLPASVNNEDDERVDAKLPDSVTHFQLIDAAREITTRNHPGNHIRVSRLNDGK
jgi:hypothetical protein